MWRRRPPSTSATTSSPTRMTSLVFHRTVMTAIVIFLFLPRDSSQGVHERRLIKDLLRQYEVMERPVEIESMAVTVQFGVNLQQIIDVHEKKQLLTANLWLQMDWFDWNLQWNESEYGGVTSIRMSPDQVWRPDILMYNSADEAFDSTYKSNVVVLSSGHCNYIPPGIFKSTCKIDITWFPFDDQRCKMKFGSWTYDGNNIDLCIGSNMSACETGLGDTSGFIENGEWTLMSVTGERHVTRYTCCPEPYVDITFTIWIRRRTLYFLFNLVIPCALISSMTLLSFTLPPDSGEKLTLGVTIVLSLTVFQTLVAENMPATSDAVPLIGTYFGLIMLVTALSVCSTVVVLNFHHRNANTHVMPRWMRLVFLNFLPRLLCMKRPEDIAQMQHDEQVFQRAKKQSIHAKLKELELKDRSSRSLLANVLDIDDDVFRMPSNAAAAAAQQSAAVHRGGMQHHPGCSEHPAQHDPYNAKSPYMNNVGSVGGNSYGNSTSAAAHVGTPPHIYPSAPPPSAPPPGTPPVVLGGAGAAPDIRSILKELQYMTDRFRREDELSEITSEWKFAAMVLDRVCLWVFMGFTISITTIVLLSAPHVLPDKPPGAQ